MSRRLARLALSVVALGGVALATSGCLVGSPASITATADFTDVSNLVSGAPVQMAGITVGTVSSIALTHQNHAKVLMSIQRSAQVPADVTAEVEQSTVLGEEVVQLVQPAHPASGARLLADGGTIRNTALVPGIEQFIGGGTAVLGSIGTSQLAALVNAGGVGLGGQADTLKALIGDLNHVMAGYSTRTGEIHQLVGSLDELSSSLASSSGSDAQAITNLSKTIGVLDQQSGRFEQLLASLDSLATQGRSLLEQQLSSIDVQWQSLAGITSTLDGQQQALVTFLDNLTGHNMVLHDVTVSRFAQVVDAIIVCGLPNGGSSSQAASSCHGAG